MGMITRVRGRLHSITKIDPELKDEKIAETVCLLSVLFLLPYCGRGHAPLLLGLGGMWLAMYSFLVLPVLISANYKYPVRWLRRLIQNVPSVNLFLSKFTTKIECIYQFLGRCFNAYRKMSSFHSAVNQLFVFAICDTFIKKYYNDVSNASTTIIALNTLLFYYVFTYFLKIVINIIENEMSHRADVNGHQRNRPTPLWLFILKLIIEWAKACLAILCIKEEGIRWHPNPLYSIITFTYYAATEKTYINLLTTFIQSFHLSIFDELEYLYVPMLLDLFSVCLSLIIVIFIGHDKLSPYFNIEFIFHTILFKLEVMVERDVMRLQYFRELLKDFPDATDEELHNWNDICPICLLEMKQAKITRCKHLFHSHCLRRCLNNSSTCPYCKTTLLIQPSIYNPFSAEVI